MKIYLAARYGRRAELVGYRETLRELGHVVTSRWLDTAVGDVEPESTAEHAITDITDIIAADTFVAFTEAPDSTFARGGRHVEFGYAMPSLMRKHYPEIHVIGPRENVFHLLPEITQHDSFAEFLTHINHQS